MSDCGVSLRALIKTMPCGRAVSGSAELGRVRLAECRDPKPASVSGLEPWQKVSPRSRWPSADDGIILCFEPASCFCPRRPLRASIPGARVRRNKEARNPHSTKTRPSARNPPQLHDAGDPQPTPHPTAPYIPQRPLFTPSVYDLLLSCHA